MTQPTNPPARPTAETAQHTGLTAAEVAERRAAGKVNVSPSRTSRSYGEIIKANVLTRFNAIITVLAVVVLIFGEPFDALFAVVMVANIVIGIVQETRAKQTLDGLRVLIAPTVTVRRDGRDEDVVAEELVVDDVVLLRPGDQVPVDARVLEEATFEVDESALTGEADAVSKAAGDDVLSGSAVVAGTATVVAVRVGSDAWIHQLVVQAKQFTPTTSELRVGVDRILRAVTWLLPPLTALLLWSQLREHSSVEEGLVAAVAGVVGLVPQGLVLLVSMALAVAIIRLARQHVVVQELYAVEGLARIDVLCLDKTGTLTTGHFEVEHLQTFDGEDDIRSALAALAASEPTPTATMTVLARDLEPVTGWQASSQVAFSSARKWSGATFDERGTWVIGAPEVLSDAIADTSTVDQQVAELTADARRVLLVAHTSAPLDGEDVLPEGLRPVGLVVLAEQVRADAAETMAYFARQNVVLKIISGDNPLTVSAVARGLGVEGAEHFVDLRTVEAPFDAIVESATVFGRVLPEQKRDLVEALQRAGHNVAMTGDGVNDIPALKRADIGIAMDTATPATKAVAQVVLLDGRFDRLPHVVQEGRRVIANMERVSSLFVTKTVYASLLALLVGVSGVPYPFLPRHMSLVSELTIGIPAFALSFRAADAPSRPGYLRRVLDFAVPAGTAAATATLTAYWLNHSGLVNASLAEARTAATVTLLATGLWILARMMRPLDRFDLLLLIALVVAAVCVLALPQLIHLYDLDWPPVSGMVISAAAVATVPLVFSLVAAALRRRPLW